MSQCGNVHRRLKTIMILHHQLRSSWCFHHQADAASHIIHSGIDVCPGRTDISICHFISTQLFTSAWEIQLFGVELLG